MCIVQPVQQPDSQFAGLDVGIRNEDVTQTDWTFESSAHCRGLYDSLGLAIAVLRRFANSSRG